MGFLSFSFALFLLVVVPAYWLAPLPARKPLLVCASLAFYAIAYPPHALLICALVLLCYWLGARLPRASEERGKALFVLSILIFVGVLGYFKYARLLVSTLADLGGPVLRAPDARIPLGISFFTFEFIHYLTDVRLGKIGDRERRGRLLDFSLFALFFPTLLSGPIKRYQSFLSEGELHQRFRPAYVAEGLCRMAAGLGKKVVIADSMTSFSSRLLTPDQVTPAGLWLAMYAYAVKIYFDFAGYSDLAIGAARLFGYRVPENFDNPYVRRNLSVFWRHWHMSLSSWIRDYLFIPLGGSRVAPWRAALNLTVVMGLCGLWHGASWNFVAWGLWHGVGMAGLRAWDRLEGRGFPPKLRPAWLGQAVATAVTFQYVCLGWVLFATPTLRVALLALSRMFGIKS